MKGSRTCKREEKKSIFPFRIVSQCPEMEILQNCKGLDIAQDRYQKKSDQCVVVLKWTQFVLQEISGRILAVLVL